MFQRGHEVAGYRIERMIGTGGMAQVFLAEQLRLRRQVALKIVRLDVKADLPPGKAEPAEELTREALALMALEHPHILPLYDTGREEDMAYLAMPYIPEGSLRDALRPGPHQQLQFPLPPGEALYYLEQAASALQYAHDRGFVHRDVKPANFLVRSLTRPGETKQTTKRLHLFLADFGLSKFISYSSSSTRVSGTPVYMAPEQFQGRISPAVDQYALAALLYYLVTGEPPFHGAPMELMFYHLNEPAPLASERAAGVPESLARVIQRGMAKKPDERYPSVTALAEAAREALVAAGLAISLDSYPAVAAVQPAATPQGQPTLYSSEANPEAPGVTAGSAPTLADPASAFAQVGTKDAPPARTDVGSGAQDENSLGSMPTIPFELSRGPSNTPPPPGQDTPQPPRRPRRRIALAALAAIIVLGAILGAGWLLQPYLSKALTAQQGPAATAQPAATSIPPTATATVTLPTPTATVVPPGDILTSILAQQPVYKVDLDAGDAQWDFKQFHPNTNYYQYTPSGKLHILNVTTTLNARTFTTPLAVAIAVLCRSEAAVGYHDWSALSNSGPDAGFPW
jgi:serine/threonine protein kinase